MSKRTDVAVVDAKRHQQAKPISFKDTASLFQDLSVQVECGMVACFEVFFTKEKSDIVLNIPKTFQKLPVAIGRGERAPRDSTVLDLNRQTFGVSRANWLCHGEKWYDEEETPVLEYNAKKFKGYSKKRMLLVALRRKTEEEKNHPDSNPNREYVPVGWSRCEVFKHCIKCDYLCGVCGAGRKLLLLLLEIMKESEKRSIYLTDVSEKTLYLEYEFEPHPHKLVNSDRVVFFDREHAFKPFPSRWTVGKETLEISFQRVNEPEKRHFIDVFLDSKWAYFEKKRRVGLRFNAMRRLKKRDGFDVRPQQFEAYYYTDGGEREVLGWLEWPYLRNKIVDFISDKWDPAPFNGDGEMPRVPPILRGLTRYPNTWVSSFQAKMIEKGFFEPRK